MPGARLHYAVPALLAAQDALAAFYTDIHGEHRLLQLLAKLPAVRRPAALSRLLARRLPPGLDRQLVREVAIATLAAHLPPLMRRGSTSNAGAVELVDRAVIKRAIADKFGGASALYSCFINNDREAVRTAKSLGMHVVHELFIGAEYPQVLYEERALFPGIEEQEHSPADIEAHQERTRQKWQLCDQVLVPSQHVYDSSLQLGCDPAKLAIVPYGLNAHWLALEADPQPGRILCVGHVGLRKGNHYLAQACSLLRQRHVRFECRVAGPLQVDVSDQLFAGPTYLGTIPRSRIQEEFRKADLFVLPTLADSFGLVHLEAMACGVPVITTPNCGSIIRDGIEGFVVPIRDAAALADRMEQLLGDPALRRQMGQAARHRAAAYTWEHYGRRLQAALWIEKPAPVQ